MGKGRKAGGAILYPPRAAHKCVSLVEEHIGASQPTNRSTCKSSRSRLARRDIMLTREQEKQLQQQTNSSDNVGNTKEISKALHTMAAHLHRYKSETNMFGEVVSGLSSCSQCTCFSNHTEESQTTYASATRMIGAEIKALQVSVEELERKTRTMLGLVGLS